MSDQASALRQFVAGRDASRAARPVAPGRSGAGATSRVRSADAQPAVVAVGAGKGGVGTSTVAALLAATMALTDRDVLLVDAGARFGALHMLLGVEPAHPVEALRGGGAQPEDLLVSVAPSLTLLPGGPSSESATLSAAERRLLFRRVVALYPRYDLVVVDAGATLDTMLAVCADGVGRFLAVGGADRIAAVATYALIKALHAAHPALQVEILANRHDAETAERSYGHVRAAADHFLDRDIPFAGTIPDDPLFASALAAGMGVHEAADGSSASQAMHVIGERLCAELSHHARLERGGRRSGSVVTGATLRLQP